MSATTSPLAPMPIWQRAWIVVSVLAIFGPYLAGGLRTEQFAMYASAAAVVLTQLPRLSTLLRPVAGLLALWGTYVVLVVAAGLLVSSTMPWPTGSLVAGTDNALLPIATIVAVAFWTRVGEPREILRLVSLTIASAMSVNALLAVVSNYLGLGALPFLSWFWAPRGSDVTVATLSEQMGRYSGVFNQPAEAGVAYSLALLCVLYLVRRGVGPRRWVLWSMAGLLVVGGLLTLSKVFVVGGMFVGFVYALTDRQHRRTAVAVGVGVTGLAIVLGLLNAAGNWGAGIMLNWYRASYLAGDSFLYTATAGRLGTAGTEGDSPSIVAPPVAATPEGPSAGSGSGGADVGGQAVAPGPADDVPLPTGLNQILTQVWDHHPVTGVGAKGLQVAYDSTWAEAVIVGGTLGLLLLVAVHALVAIQWFRLRHLRPRAEWLFGGAVVLLVLGSSFGMPTLTGNRESTMLWVLLGLLVFAHRRADAAPDVAEADESSAQVLERR